MQPLFINLSAIPAEMLEVEGGFFGWVLRLIQQRKSRPREFQRLLNRVVQHLETMPDAERRRWLELLSYIMALVYHVREPSERPSLQQTIEASVLTDEHRQEVFEMRRTIADELKEERRVSRSSQQTLIRLLKRRFGKVPDEVTLAVRACRDPCATGRVVGPLCHGGHNGRSGNRSTRLSVPVAARLTGNSKPTSRHNADPGSSTDAVRSRFAQTFQNLDPLPVLAVRIPETPPESTPKFSSAAR